MNTYAEAKWLRKMEGYRKVPKVPQSGEKVHFLGDYDRRPLPIVATLSVAIYPKRDKEQKPREKQVLSMPANGNSPHLPTKPGHAIEWTGSGLFLFAHLLLRNLLYRIDAKSAERDINNAVCAEDDNKPDDAPT